MKALFTYLLLALCMLYQTSQAQSHTHVHNGFTLVAERIPGGAIVEMEVNKDLPEDLVFPLPSGTYNIYLTSRFDSALATGYIRFNASAKNVQIQQGSQINLTSVTTPQALVLLDTAGYEDPVISLAAQPDGRAWTMWEQGDHYYAYVDVGYEWAIGTYRFKPNAGEVWKLSNVVVSFKGDPLGGGTVEPEPEQPTPPQPITIEGEAYTDCTCPPLRPSVTGTPGLGGTNIGAWAKYPGINLTGMTSIEFRQSSINTGRRMEIRIDAPNGPIIGTYDSNSTGDWETYDTFSTSISQTDGVHDLYFVFLDHAVMDIDKFVLKP